MKEAGNVDDIDLLLSDMSHHEKTILADLDRLGNVTADRQWRENTAKVCSATLHLPNQKSCYSVVHMKVYQGGPACIMTRRTAHVSQYMGDLMQRRLHHLQNPKDCDSARKLVCSLTKPCGFGCQMHHVMYCFIVAYATERTLILKSEGMYVEGVCTYLWEEGRKDAGCSVVWSLVVNC